MPELKIKVGKLYRTDPRFPHEIIVVTHVNMEEEEFEYYYIDNPDEKYFCDRLYSDDFTEINHDRT
jgi:hypothetical protein